MFSAASKTASSSAANYIEDVFSTWLYTGNGSTQTITNGIDLAGKGGLVWTKPRTTTTFNDHILVDSARGDFQIQSNTTAANNAIASFNFASTGYTAPSNTRVNASSVTYASWTFRKQPKFFDIQTWTGSGANRTISHNLGSVPACIMVKRTDTTGDWQVYHRSLANTEYLVLNSTAAKATGATRWNSTTPTDTVFSLGTDATVNASGGTYVAYIFAHNAGGFGLTGTDNVISCGSYVGTGNITVGQNIELGWEPQWVMVKSASSTNGWVIADSMRGFTVNVQGSNNYNRLYANATTAENEINWLALTPTGFNVGVQNNNETGTNGTTYIYIAIRKGPMKVPTDGTKVFEPALYTGDNATFRAFTSSTVSPVDSVLTMGRVNAYGTGNLWWVDRLRGNGVIRTDYTEAETSAYSSLKFDYQNGYSNNAAASYYGWNPTGASNLNYFLKRAPGFMDVCCYTGTGANRTVAHNLAAVPELMIVKGRSGATAWQVYSSALANTQYLVLDTTAAVATGATRWNSTTPTSSVFSLGTASEVNTSAATYVAHLFASCPGVSKVGSYTGTGTTKQVDCGFTGGARFILIKRTDSTGDWYVWDSARGIVAGNDPYLLLNSTAAEVTNTDYVDTYSAGFEISSTAPAAINASGGTFIFLAIA